MLIRAVALSLKETQAVSKAQIKPNITAKDAMRKAIAAAMSRSNAEIPQFVDFHQRVSGVGVFRRAQRKPRH
jgi:hypothetical protein